jgi:uncharacterized protein
MSSNSRTTLEQFFSAFGQGNLEKLVSLFASDAHIMAVRDVPNAPEQLHGRYSGQEGVRDFLSRVGATLDTQAFRVDAMGGDGELAFARGSFTHLVKRTQKPFSSEWALLCTVQNGQIKEYRFYEDSAAFSAANSAAAE